MKNKKIKFNKNTARVVIWTVIGCLISAGLMYRHFFVDSGCLFKAIFGFPCPTCGMSRAFVSLLTLDFEKAIYYNPGIFAVPFVLISGLLALFDKKRTKLWFIVMMLFILVILIIWIVRLIMGTTV